VLDKMQLALEFRALSMGVGIVRVEYQVEIAW